MNRFRSQEETSPHRTDAPHETHPSGDASPALLWLWKHRGWLLVLCDAILICLSFVGAYHARFYLDPLLSAIPPPIPEIPSLEPYLQVSALTGAVWVFLIWKDKGYEKEQHLSRALGNQVWLVLTTGFYAWVFLMVISFMYRYFLLSRVVYAIAMLCSFVALAGVRALMLALERRIAAAGLLNTRTLLMGWSPGMGVVLERLRASNRGGQIIGWIGEPNAQDHTIPAPSGIQHLGDPGDLQRIYERTPFDQLFVGSHGRDPNWNEAVIHAINFCEGKGIFVYMVPGFLDVVVRRREVGTIAGIPFIRLQDSSFHPAYLIVKRVMDMAISAAVLLLGLPLWLPTALIIKLTSKGPVLFAQVRAGLHGKPFRMYKFRSMIDGADQMLDDLVKLDELKEPVFNIRKDPRVTPLGRILRRSSLDEIPQFWNVFTGSLSIVGPRPERMELVDRYNAYQWRRLKAKPGITGYQQVMSRGEPSLAKRIEYDLHYLKYQSLFLDLFIILKTLLVVIRGDGTK